MDEGSTGKAGSRGEASESLSPAALFDLVVARHTAMISRIALAYEADPALRRELVQEIMLAVWRGLAQFRHDSSLKTFVAGIAYKRSISHVARAAKRPKSAQLSDAMICEEPLPDEVSSRNQLKARLRELVRTLPLAQKQAIVLCLEDFSFKEIGDTLGISAHAAAMRCQRAKDALREAMENWT